MGQGPSNVVRLKPIGFSSLSQCFHSLGTRWAFLGLEWGFAPEG